MSGLGYSLYTRINNVNEVMYVSNVMIKCGIHKLKFSDKQSEIDITSTKIFKLKLDERWALSE
jgi:hypothetical protein